MKSFGDILNSGTFSSPLLKGITAAKIIDIANANLIKEFGQNATNFASAVSYKNGILTIAFLSGAAAQELRFIEERYINELNSAIGGKKIQKIKYLI